MLPAQELRKIEGGCQFVSWEKSFSRIFMQYPTPSPHRKASRMHSLVCIVLAICSWRGPVPVLHHHDQYSAESRLQHLAVFHETSADCAGGCKEWHWHIAIPGSTDSSEGTPSQQVPVDVCTLAFCVALDSSSLNSVLELPLQNWLNFQSESFGTKLPVPKQACVLPDQWPSFLSDQLCSVDLSSLTGVALI